MSAQRDQEREEVQLEARRNSILHEHPEYSDPIKVAALVQNLQQSNIDLQQQLDRLKNVLGETQDSLAAVEGGAHGVEVALAMVKPSVGLSWDALSHEPTADGEDPVHVLTGCKRHTFYAISQAVAKLDLQSMWSSGGSGRKGFPDVRTVFLWVLVTLRLGLSKSVCGYLLGIKRPAKKANAFNRGLAMLAALLDNLYGADVFSNEEFQSCYRTQPFMGGFTFVHLIGDCSSTPCQCPAGNHLQRKFLYSAYYGCTCIKWGLAINAAGFIEWVSIGYCGNSADDVVCSELVPAVIKGWTLMYDKGGGSLCHLCKDAGIGHKTPHSVSQGRLTNAEFRASREISGRRSHVERAVRTVKSFRVLTSTVGVHDFEAFDDVLLLIKRLCNLNQPLAIHATDRGASEGVESLIS